MARIAKEPEDLFYVLVPPASVLDAVGRQYRESGLNPNSSHFCFPAFDEVFKAPSLHFTCETGQYWPSCKVAVEP